MPKQLWEFDPAKRETNAKPIFVIFCEDEVSEPIYFESFRTETIKINVIGGQKQGMQNVLNALKYCGKNDLMEGVGEYRRLKAGNIHVWCVFDRDLDVDDRDIELSNITFDEAIHLANLRGIKVAWSNDVFELWILMHFEDVDTNLPENQLRQTYYHRLTDIFKNLPEKNEDLIKALSHASFSYKKDLKRETNFRQIVRPELIPNTHLALQRAKTLESHHATPNKPNHQKAPCTMVHHLVEKLLETGRKEV